jgi:hypothetical protein
MLVMVAVMVLARSEAKNAAMFASSFGDGVR